MINSLSPEGAAPQAAPPALRALVDLLLRAAQEVRLEPLRDASRKRARAGVAGSGDAAEPIFDTADAMIAFGAETEPHVFPQIEAEGGAQDDPDSAQEGARESAQSYLQEVRTLARLGPAAELHLLRIARSPEASAARAAAARRQIIRANLWLVPVIVRRFYRSGVGFDDLVAEGNMGLYKAFERFDPARGFRFSTYAKWWVIDAVTRAMAANAYPVRVPRKVALELARSQRDDAGGSTAGDRPRGAPHGADEEAASRSQGDRFDDALGHDAAQSGTSAPEQIVALRQALQLLAHAVAELPPRERVVIEGRYGLNGSAERTLQEIGSEIGVTAERVRTLQIAAMDKLRQHLGATRL